MAASPPTAGAAPPAPLPLGRATGHFGEFLQGRLGPGGAIALVTLPCPALAVEARWQPGPLALSGDADAVTSDQVRALLRALDLPPLGRFALTAGMAPGIGAGASTAALLAVARAAGMAAGRQATPEALAAACLAAEGATDPLMCDAAATCLWAPREARRLEPLTAPAAFEVIGGTFGAPQRTDPEDEDFADISDLLPHWRRAVAGADRAAVAGIATEAARRTTARRGPAGDPTEALGRQLGALGIARAHTGSARALLFAPGGLPAGAAAALAEAGLQGVFGFRTP